MSGRFMDQKAGSALTEGSERVAAPSSPSGRFSLRDGTVLPTVRKDVLDRALGRGDYKKK